MHLSLVENYLNKTTNFDPKTMTHAELSAWLAEHLMGCQMIDWSPPTNIQQAMEDVVPAIVERDFGVDICLAPGLVPVCRIKRAGGRYRNGVAKTTARAICEAAYLALVERGE